MMKNAETWWVLFQEQLADAVAQVQSFAQRRARLIALAGGISDADDLIAAALVDTLGGVVEWDPSRKMLAAHLRDVIQSRSRHDFARSNRFPMARFGVWEEWILAVPAAPEPQVDDNHKSVALVGQVIAELRQLADGDAAVLRILDAYQGGAVIRSDVIAASGLTSVKYQRARRRLRRKSRQLSPALRAAARVA
jgi:hypothetical protein